MSSKAKSISGDSPFGHKTMASWELKKIKRLIFVDLFPDVKGVG
jgi:hypothetical protein